MTFVGQWSKKSLILDDFDEFPYPDCLVFFEMQTTNTLPTGFRPLGKPIDVDDTGRRIDEYLAANFPFMSRTLWKKKIQEGQVVINTTVIRGSYRLKNEDSVSYFRPQTEEPEVDKNIEVIWENSGVIAVYKPSNLPMHEGGRYYKNTFSEVIKDKVGPEWAAVHRLDRETSGIVLCAATTHMRNLLSEEFSKRAMKKVYLAIARGVPEKNEWIVDEPIGDQTESKFRLKKWVIPDGLPSITTFQTIAATESHSLLRVFPKTGRTHQIRVHAAWSGLPLVGEKKYYPDEDVYLEYMEHGITENVLRLTECRRLCLHATAIGFVHPITGLECKVVSEMPADMHAAWQALQNPDSRDEGIQLG
jgi:RluA family pseudouridine synthase